MALHLLERDQEVAALTVLLEACVGGQGRVALISGEAGIGKTALIEHVLAHAPPGVRTLWGACEALFAPRPLGPLFDIAPQLPPTMRALLAGEVHRATLFATLLEELRARPSILVMEDLHWADEATLDFIKYLARRIVQTQTLLLLTYREEELGRDHPLRLVVGELPTREVTRLRLLPLSLLAVTALAQQTSRPAQELQELYAATGGNPFFLTEILAGEVADAAEVAPVPLSVSDAILARVARRSREAQRLLEVSAVSPGRVERWVLEALGAGDDAALDECLASGLLHLDGHLLSFRHELARRRWRARSPRHGGKHSMRRCSMRCWQTRSSRPPWRDWRTMRPRLKTLRSCCALPPQRRNRRRRGARDVRPSPTTKPRCATPTRWCPSTAPTCSTACRTSCS